MLLGEFPQHEIAGIAQAEIACAVQTLANVAAFSNFATRPVLFLLGSANLAEVDLDVRRELQCRPMEGTGFLL